MKDVKAEQQSNAVRGMEVWVQHDVKTNPPDVDVPVPFLHEDGNVWMGFTDKEAGLPETATHWLEKTTLRLLIKEQARLIWNASINYSFKKRNGSEPDFETFIASLPSTTAVGGYSREDMENYGKKILSDISKTLLYPYNQAKAERQSDKEVFQALGETILNFPLPSLPPKGEIGVDVEAMAEAKNAGQ